MSLLHSLLAMAYRPLRLGNHLLRYVGAKSNARIRVLLYHDIAPQEQKIFASQLRWLARSWTFVSPRQFERMMRGEIPIKGSNLLLSFDDGFASNRIVAEEVLNPMGIKALFFVVSDFVNIGKGDDYKAFIARYMWPRLTAETIPNHWRNMSWEDLAWLLKTGHTVGAHTRRHARLSLLRQMKELNTEIIDSANLLESNLGVEINHFAYPFGNLSSFSPEALAVARKRFAFIHTNLRGDNLFGSPLWAVRRDAMVPVNSHRLVGSLLEGGADIRYARDLAKCELWAKLQET